MNWPCIISLHSLAIVLAAITKGIPDWRWRISSCRFNCDIHKLLGTLVALENYRNDSMSAVGKPLEVTWPKPSAQAEPSTARSPGPCTSGFWTSPRRKAPQDAWTALCQCWVNLTLKICFLLFRGHLQFLLIVPSLVTGRQWKESALLLFATIECPRLDLAGGKWAWPHQPPGSWLA